MADEEFKEILVSQRGEECEYDGCGETTGIEVAALGDGSVSMDSVELRCQKHLPGTLTQEQVLNHLEESTLPFTTVNRVADVFGVSESTARRRLNELEEASELEQEGISGEPFFRLDYRAASELMQSLREHMGPHRS